MMFCLEESIKKKIYFNINIGSINKIDWLNDLTIRDKDTSRLDELATLIKLKIKNIMMNGLI